jgi:DNA-binding transcriptional regulator YiaG
MICNKKIPTFGKRIKAARKKANLSQSKAAQKWGFAKGTLCGWEIDRFVPMGLYREKLEAVLKEIGC